MIYMERNIYTVPRIEEKKYRTFGRLYGKDYYKNATEIMIPELSTLFLGAPGCGKSTQIKKIIKQLSKNPDSINIIFDIKQEYLPVLYEPGDYILTMHNIEGYPDEAQVQWSFLKEAYLDTEPEDVLHEIAGTIFENAIKESQSPAFPEAAKQLFNAQVISIYRKCIEQNILISNRELIEIICNNTEADIKKLVEQFPDLSHSMKLLSEKKNVTAFGIQMELEEVMNKVFMQSSKSNFFSYDSNFSIREFIHEGRGKKLFIMLGFHQRKITEEIVRLLIDIAMKESISGVDLRDEDQTRYNFFLDEYAFLPELNYLDVAKNLARSKGVRIYAGIQNISQLKAMHREEEQKAMDDIAGFSNLVLFNSNDPETVKFVKERAGEEYRTSMYVDALCNVHTDSRLEPLLSDRDIYDLRTGEAFIIPNEGRPFWFKFDK